MDRRRRIITVEEYRKAIRKLEKQQDKLFNAACKALGIDPQSKPNSDILFDHLFNKPTKTDEQIVEELWPVPAATKSSETKLPTIQDQDRLASPGDLR